MQKREAKARRTELKKMIKERRKLKAESVSPESISDTDFLLALCVISVR